MNYNIITRIIRGNIVIFYLINYVPIKLPTSKLEFQKSMEKIEPTYCRCSKLTLSKTYKELCIKWASLLTKHKNVNKIDSKYNIGTIFENLS